MTTFYDLLDNLSDRLKEDAIVNTVTTGDIFQVDLAKQSIFPLCHIIVNNATKLGSAWEFNVSIIAMDIVDKNSDSAVNTLAGNDNTHDVLNTQFGILNRLIDVIQKSSTHNQYNIVGDPSLESFTERFENFMAGWVMTFNIVLPNAMSKC